MHWQAYPGTNKSHDNYKYVIENCDKIVGGDRIREHFQRNSKLQVLDEAKKMDVSGEIVNGLKQGYIARFALPLLVSTYITS